MNIEVKGWPRGKQLEFCKAGDVVYALPPQVFMVGYDKEVSYEDGSPRGDVVACVNLETGKISTIPKHTWVFPLKPTDKIMGFVLENE